MVVVYLVIFFIVSVSEACYNISNDDYCSTNLACGCFRCITSFSSGLCKLDDVPCSQLASCRVLHNTYCQPGRICSKQRVNNCCSLSTALETKCQSKVVLSITTEAHWTQKGITIAGDQEPGSELNQFYFPSSLGLDDDDQHIVVADYQNHRVLQWKIGDAYGNIVAGGHGFGKGPNQLHNPCDVVIDTETNSFIICNRGSASVVRWSRNIETKEGEILLDRINCNGIAIDGQRYLYVSDAIKNEVKRYRIGDNNDTVVAGGHGKGNGLNQLDEPSYIFVDQQQAIYVSDTWNHRVMKWNKDAKEGIIVAGGHGRGEDLNQLSYPRGLFVDLLNTVYVVDAGNDRVMRWIKGASQGTVLVGGNDRDKVNELNTPMDLSFDEQGDLYVADHGNHRIQRFALN